MSRRRFRKEFKTAAAQRPLRGESGSAPARELDVKRARAVGMGGATGALRR